MLGQLFVGGNLKPLPFDFLARCRCMSACLDIECTYRLRSAASLARSKFHEALQRLYDMIKTDGQIVSEPPRSHNATMLLSARTDRPIKPDD